MNIFDIFNRKNVPNYNVTLRNFLNWLLYNKENKKNFKAQIKNNDYSSKEKNMFLYNCAIITINDFFTFEQYYKKPKEATIAISKLYEQNFKLLQFDNVEVADEVPNNSKKIIEQFGNLKRDLTSKEKNYVMKETHKLLTST